MEKSQHRHEDSMIPIYLVTTRVNPALVLFKLDTDHDFAQFVAFGPDVVHEHLIGCELVLDGQRVVLTLLHLLQLDPFTQVPHHLNPESSLTEEAKGTIGKGKYKIP